MIKLEDLVALAKGGWTPKATKEILEMLETSPNLKDAAPEDVKDAKDKQEEPKEDPKPEVKPEEEDPIEALKKLLSED